MCSNSRAFEDCDVTLQDIAPEYEIPDVVNPSDFEENTLYATVYKR